ncbi:MAG: hypothetical protein R3C19_02310 [Planctomycetaceae bacterium]
MAFTFRTTAFTVAMLLAAISNSPGSGLFAQVGPDVVRPYPEGEPALSADRVYVSRDEFLKLYRLANPGQLQGPATAHEASVTAAIYNSEELRQINAASWSQSFRARFVIRSFNDVPVNVALPLGAVAVRSAKLDGDNAILQPIDGRIPQPGIPEAPLGQGEATSAEQLPIGPPNQFEVPEQQQANTLPPAPPIVAAAYSVRIAGSGLHVLDVLFEVPAVVEESVGRLQIPLVAVPAGTLTFQLPDSGDASGESGAASEPTDPDGGSGSAEASSSRAATQLAVTVNGRTNTFRRDGRSIVVPVSPGGNLRIQWQPETSKTSADAVFHSVVHSALTIDDEGLTVQATVAVNVRQGQVAELGVRLPAGYSVQQVAGSELAGWSLDESADSPSLKLLFKQPIDGTTAVDVQLFSRQVFSTDRTTVAVPVPVVTDASRDTGNVCVLAGSELQIRTESLSGVSQINPLEAVLPNGIEGSPRRVLAWRYTRHPVSVSVRVSREADKLEITGLHGVQLEAQRQLWTSHIAATISGAPRRRLDLVVPRSYLALEVNANDLADWYVTDPDDAAATTKTISVQFSAARTGPVNVVIQGQTDRAADPFQPALFAPRIPAATSAESKLSVWLDAATEIAGFTADGWSTVGPGQVDSRILQLQSDSPDISFTSQSTDPSTVSLNLREAKASVLAESVSVTNVTDTSLELTLALNWQISRAATSSLSFELPAGLADVFDFKVPELRQLQKTAIDGDRVRLTFHLQRPVSESFFLLGVGTLPLPADRQVTAQPPAFVTNGEADTSTTITNQSHFWVIVNQSTGVMEAVSLDEDGDDISADQIRTEIPEGFLQQSVAIRRLNAGRAQSPWRLRFPEPQQVTPAVIALAEHVTILAEDASWRSRHHLQVRNESRQFLPVFIPKDSRFLYCLVKGQPTRVVTRAEGESTLYLIPVPQSGAVSAPFDVEFALAGLVDQSAMNLDDAWRQRALKVPVPSFPEYRDFPEFGVTVSRNTWSVYVPKAWQAAMEDDPRRTNVVPADEGDFIDAEVYSATESVKSLFEASGKLVSAEEQARRDAELVQQRERLSRQRGTEALVEAERTRALQQIDEYFAQQEEPGELQFDSASGFAIDAGRSLSSGGVISGNSFLYEQDAKQNFFNGANNDRFFMDNSTRGFEGKARGGQQPGGALNFNFTLPEESQPQTAAPAVPSDAEKGMALGRRPLKEEAASKAQSADGIRKRSQLIEQKKSGMQREFEEVNSPAWEGRLQLGDGVDRDEAEAPQAADGAVPLSDTRSGESDQSMESLTTPFGLESHTIRNLTNDQLDDLGIVILRGDKADTDRLAGIIAAQESLQRSGTGLLSLQFAIPTDGQRHDFVRPAGNPELTLEVRGSEAVETGFGTLWAAACVVALLFLLRSAASGNPRTLIHRLLLVAAIAGLCGWLLLPAPVNSWSGVVFAASAIAFCVCLVTESFRATSRRS